MFVKLTLIACYVAVSTAVWHAGLPAHQYPAGVNPHSCPNYPYCDNPAVAAHSHVVAAPYAYAGLYNHLGAYHHHHDNSGAYVPSNALESGQYTGDGDWHGEGLAEAGAYGDVSQHYHGAPALHGAHWAGYAPAHVHAHQLPAGVSPHSCPNYPFCH